MFVRRYRTLTLAVALVTALATVPAAETTVTSPKQFFGFSIGDDYQLANYTQLAEYWHKLERESNRMKVVEIGKTSEGRPQLMAIISSPENLKKLDAYKDDRGPPRARGRTHRRSGPPAREGRQGGRLDRRRPARDRGARRASADRDGLPDGQPDGCRDRAVPERRDPPVRAREP